MTGEPSAQQQAGQPAAAAESTRAAEVAVAAVGGATEAQPSTAAQSLRPPLEQPPLPQPEPEGAAADATSAMAARVTVAASVHGLVTAGNSLSEQTSGRDRMAVGQREPARSAEDAVMQPSHMADADLGSQGAAEGTRLPAPLRHPQEPDGTGAVHAVPADQQSNDGMRPSDLSSEVGHGADSGLFLSGSDEPLHAALPNSPQMRPGGQPVVGDPGSEMQAAEGVRAEQPVVTQSTAEREEVVAHGGFSGVEESTADGQALAGLPGDQASVGANKNKAFDSGDMEVSDSSPVAALGLQNAGDAAADPNDAPSPPAAAALVGTHEEVDGTPRDALPSAAAVAAAQVIAQRLRTIINGIQSAQTLAALATMQADGDIDSGAGSATHTVVRGPLPETSDDARQMAAADNGSDALTFVSADHESTGEAGSEPAMAADYGSAAWESSLWQALYDAPALRGTSNEARWQH